MMWMMIPCIILLGVLLLSRGRFSSSGYFWLIIVGVCVGPHIWMMLKGHGGYDDAGTEDKTSNPAVKQSEVKDGGNKHKHGGC